MLAVSKGCGTKLDLAGADGRGPLTSPKLISLRAAAAAAAAAGEQSLTKIDTVVGVWRALG